MTLKQLSLLSLAWNRTKYPLVPSYAVSRPHYSDKTANGLTKAILDYCKFYGIFAQRVSAEGRYRQGQTVTDVIGRTRQMKGMFIPGFNKGQGDILMVLNGQAISIEIKIGPDKQSDVQKAWESKFSGSGGIYQIIKTWDEFYRFFWEVKNLNSVAQ